MIHQLLIKQSFYSTFNKNGEGVCRFHALTHLSEPTRTYFPKSSANTPSHTPSRDRGRRRTPTNDSEQPISRRKSVWSISSRTQSSRGDHDPAEVRADTKISKHKYLPDPVNGVRTRSVQVMRPSEPWGQTPMVFSWTANETHNAQDVCRILVPPPNFGR